MEQEDGTMIFISKKAFENEVEKRMAEIHFKNRTDEKIWEIEENIRNLRFRLDCLEERERTPVPKVNCGSESCCSPLKQECD